jgi:hypothetical protein
MTEKEKQELERILDALARSGRNVLIGLKHL